MTPAPRGPQRRRQLVVAAVVLVGAVVAAAVAWQVREHSQAPQLLGPRSGGFAFEAAPAPVDAAPLHIGFMAPYEGEEDPETLTFRSATAHLQRDSAHAVATVSVCRPRTTPSGGFGGGGTVRAPTLETFCREVRPVVPGTTMRWGTETTDGEFLVLTLRPTRPGVAEVDSIALDYARDADHGGQSGVERLDGLRFLVRAE